MSDLVDRWFAAMPEEAIRAELQQLESERDELERRIEVRRQAIALKRALKPEVRLPPSQLDAPAENGEPLRGRRAIREVLNANQHIRRWRIPDMLEAIRDRGWIANTHSVQVNLSRMYRDGELGKEGNGVYVVLDEKEVPTEADTS
jgi:hypothetical protein